MVEEAEHEFCPKHVNWKKGGRVPGLKQSHGSLSSLPPGPRGCGCYFLRAIVTTVPTRGKTIIPRWQDMSKDNYYNVPFCTNKVIINSNHHCGINDKKSHGLLRVHPASPLCLSHVWGKYETTVWRAPWFLYERRDRRKYLHIYIKKEIFLVLRSILVDYQYPLTFIRSQNYYYTSCSSTRSPIEQSVLFSCQIMFIHPNSILSKCSGKRIQTLFSM